MGRGPETCSTQMFMSHKHTLEAVEFPKSKLVGFTTSEIKIPAIDVVCAAGMVANTVVAALSGRGLGMV